MLSALTRKSITDLSRRRSRTLFTVVTLALAVAGIGLFALPTLMNRSMSATVAADRLPDLTVYTRPSCPRSGAAGCAFGGSRTSPPSSRVSFFSGPVYVGARRAFAQVQRHRGLQSAERRTSCTSPPARRRPTVRC